MKRTALRRRSKGHNGLSDGYLLTLWRQAVKILCGGLSPLSGEPGDECHHIIPCRVRVLRYDVRNGIYLTKSEHQEAETIEGRDRIYAFIGSERVECLKKMERITLAQYLVEKGQTRKEWSFEQADKLREIIKE